MMDSQKQREEKAQLISQIFSEQKSYQEIEQKLTLSQASVEALKYNIESLNVKCANLEDECARLREENENLAQSNNYLKSQLEEKQ